MEKHEQSLVYIIINSIKPYAYEINNILALPKGFQYRVRYKQKWISDTLLKRITKGDFDKKHLAIRPERALLILRDFSSGYFIPLRYVNIISINKFSNVYYFRYSLDGLYRYPPLSENDKSEEHELKEFPILREIKKNIEKEIINQRGVRNIPNKDLEYLVFSVNGAPSKEPPSAEISDDESWGYILRFLRAIREPGPSLEDKTRNEDEKYVFTDFDFIRLVSVYQEKENVINDPNRIERKRGRLILFSDSLLKVNILQRTYTGRVGKGDSSVYTPRKIKIFGKPDIVEVIPVEKNITGKYEWFSFYLNIKTSHSKEVPAMLFLSIEHPFPFKSTYIEIPLIIKYRSYKVRILIQIVGILLFLSGIILVLIGNGMWSKLGTIFAILGGMLLKTHINDITSIISLRRVL